MSEKEQTKKDRVQLGNLPQKERDLDNEEAKNVKGGVLGGVTGGVLRGGDTHIGEEIPQ